MLASIISLRKLMERDHLFLWTGMLIMSHRDKYRGNFPTQKNWKSFGKNHLVTGKKKDDNVELWDSLWRDIFSWYWLYSWGHTVFFSVLLRNN